MKHHIKHTPLEDTEDSFSSISFWNSYMAVKRTYERGSKLTRIFYVLRINLTLPFVIIIIIITCGLACHTKIGNYFDI
jgi:hypothetical protein